MNALSGRNPQVSSLRPRPMLSLKIFQHPLATLARRSFAIDGPVTLFIAGRQCLSSGGHPCQLPGNALSVGLASALRVGNGMRAYRTSTPSLWQPARTAQLLPPKTFGATDADRPVEIPRLAKAHLVCAAFVVDIRKLYRVVLPLAHAANKPCAGRWFIQGQSAAAWTSELLTGLHDRRSYHAAPSSGRNVGLPDKWC
jgi:hypothetical protein